MSDGIYSALSGALAQERALQMTANNVANANTGGYKADKAVFTEHLNWAKNNLKPAPALRYATLDEYWVDNEPGSTRYTGNKLDVALHGEGYFSVQTPQGERYTRAGSFQQDRAGVLRTQEGMPMLAEVPGDPTQPGRPIVIPRDTRDVTINTDGTVSAIVPDISGSNNNQILGKLKLVRFDDQRTIEREGHTLFKTKDGTQPSFVNEETSVEQGYLEWSNVNAIHGMNELIIVNRYFDALEKVIDTYRDVDNRTARDVGGR